ncbi:MAG TPA: tetratricopeptide repeat protein, partial [Longimicrobiales bacterium]|nr:tetratricopeptide repeat protein [Longimicrobiales bacterium]
EGQLAGTDQEIVVDAAVVQTAGDTANPRPLTSQDRIEGFFDVEKQMALDLYEAVGIQLTPAERERVTQRRTENLEAALAFGLGLEAQDAGRYDEAEAQFRRAVTLDPSFDLARSALDETVDLAAATGVGIDVLAEMGYERLVTSGPYDEWIHRQLDFIDIERLLPGTSERDAASEVMGNEALTPSRAVLEIIFRRPGGAP